MHRRWPLGLCAFLLFSGPASVRAEPTDVAKQEAQKLYEDAAKDMTTRDYARACPKLEAARKILPDHVRTTMTLAECYDKLGSYASALEVFQTAQGLATAQNKPDKIEEINRRINEINPKVPRLTISLTKSVAALPGLSIVRNGVPVIVTQWGQALPVNPGRQDFEVLALDKPPWKSSIEVQAGQTATFEVKPPWADDPEKRPDASIPNDLPVNPPKEKNPPPPPPPPPPPSTSPLRIAGFVGIGLGVAGVAVGAVFGGLAVSKNAASNDGHCTPDNHCDLPGFHLRNDAVTYGNASNVAFLAGAVLGGAGIAMVVLGAPKKATASAHDSTRAALVVMPGGIGIRGGW